jgi:hypothetical protein
MKPFLFAACVLATTLSAHDFKVKLENCSEFIGVASIPLAKLQPLVPSGYQIAIGPPGFGSLVVRSSHCRSGAIEGSFGGADVTRVAQLGVVVIPPEGDGDINNYTLSYGTNNLKLALRLELAGLPVLYDSNLAYELTPDPPVLPNGGELFAEFAPELSPASWFLSGTVTDPPPGASFPFVANWWYNGRQGRIKMATSIPVLSYGGGNVKVYTRRQSLLGGLIGGNTSTFGTNLRGVFANGTLRVTTP